ncbi:MAG: L-fucose/L-arabinose isomerase family protein [Christensenellales bacterium]|jgi:L-fucose isomerase-like protein
MLNIPKVRLGIIAVSRDCFDIQLAIKRRQRVVSLVIDKGINIVECATTVRNEAEAVKALEDVKGINALIIYHADYGPEGPSTLMAQRFNGPVMFVGAAEENKSDLMNARSDAMAGLLSAGYNMSLRGINPYIPANPIGTYLEVADMIEDFYNISRVTIGIKRLKIITFGPRPQDFFACNAPIKPLFDLGVELEENSELDLYKSYKEHLGDPRIDEVTEEMIQELSGNAYKEYLPKFAALELALLDWYLEHRGACKFVIYANKCWPAFESEFGFAPCYVNSRLTAKGIPVACEVDIYGVLSEFMLQLASKEPVALLDINNNVPKELFDELDTKHAIKDLFIGFHCGNTASCMVKNPELKYHKIMHSILEPGNAPDITVGTLEGMLKASETTLFRLMSDPESRLKAYILEGEILDAPDFTFGSAGIFAIPGMARFYRHILIEKRFPHHTAVAFRKSGRIIFEALKLLGIKDIYSVSSALYPTENPF